MTFNDLGLNQSILHALNKQGYTKPTPIQEQAIPILLQGKDLLGCAQTGTGKTAAFTIPILQHLENKLSSIKGKRKIRALVVTPTRELALQIGDSIEAYGEFTHLQHTVIFGGVKQGSQTKALHNGVDILVATPGRLLDLMGQGYISLDHIEYFVLDEADQMLDMGFIHDIKKVIRKLPQKRQSLFFSATMAPAIVELSQQILGEPEQVTIRPEKPTADKVAQKVYHVSTRNKNNLLLHILNERPKESTLIFSRTKHGANKIVKKLNQNGIESDAIHGNKSQAARQNALNKFKKGESWVLVATDIAARGIDVDGLELVINYDLPNVPETYVHRIGRTGRANKAGIALSFCDRDEIPYLKDIQKLIKQSIPEVEGHPFERPEEESVEKPKKQPANSSKRNFSKRHEHHNKEKNQRNFRRKKHHKGGNPSEKKKR
ncbi:DEAD/DEAH box helicase [Marinigracilibium pacificum]|uniref:DEAD-box ATP-dependent RNA helicase RhpA n=1 Tax=Marinigracilibium pacificum TaxID=2729599 RepID=A0A848IV01_9BACT|nr:DEAD/DEAH box helicase [Marinigracilibium pacificum]NMM47516.1 DEAD/DEAH box helicase [Marinigracilibium pacificum]